MLLDLRMVHCSHEAFVHTTLCLNVHEVFMIDKLPSNECELLRGDRNMENNAK